MGTLFVLSQPALGGAKTSADRPASKRAAVMRAVKRLGAALWRAMAEDGQQRARHEVARHRFLSRGSKPGRPAAAPARDMVSEYLLHGH